MLSVLLLSKPGAQAGFRALFSFPVLLHSLLIFFLTWTFLKVFIEFVTILLLMFFFCVCVCPDAGGILAP